MSAVLALLLVPFAWGLKRGATVCAATCGSVLIPAKISGARDSVALKAGLLRALVLSAGGGFLGGLMYLAGAHLDLHSKISALGTWMYLAFSVTLLCVGAYWMIRFSGGACQARCGAGRKIPLWLAPAGGLVCLAETFLSIEGVLIAGLPGLLGPSLAAAVLLGAVAMGLFAVGSWIPTLAISHALLPLLGNRAKSSKVRSGMGIAASVFVMSVGAVLFWGSFMAVA